MIFTPHPSLFTHFPQSWPFVGRLSLRFWCKLGPTMTKPSLPLILIYGNSPQLSRVEHTLRADPGVRVIQIDPHDPSAADQVAILRQGVLLYDPATTDPALIQALRTLHPEMSVVGAEAVEEADALALAAILSARKSGPPHSRHI